jgi:toxin ParE1/3/4
VKRARISLSDAAANDILEQVVWYEEQANARLAKRWESAISQALLRIVKNPHSGSPCSFKAVELRGVRRISVAGFPRHLIFYRIDKDSLLILRIVHGARDLQSLF